MAAPRIDRRLAAILAADVVGYSRLMGEDEAGTLERLKAHRKELIEPLLAEHHGRIVKLMGDGALCEFGSVVDAVACAVAIQRGMAEREKEVPAGKKVRFRIGINLGDVIHDEGDIYGDGVNVAARLEGLAEPGGVCVSRTVYNHVKGKVDLGFEPGGEHRVKNIAEPVSVYRLLLDADPAKALTATVRRVTRRPWRRRAIAAAAAAVLLMLAGGAALTFSRWTSAPEGAAFDRIEPWDLPAEPSIAVLPFANLSRDPDQEYFVDGITNDISTDLSKFSTLFVIAANSTFRYKDQAVKVQDVARDLGVRYVLEGSVQRAGDTLRINAQLIDATTGRHVWAERYDRPAEDLFTVQKEITRNIVGAVGSGWGGLQRAELDRISRHSTENLTAYEFFLRGAAHRNRETKEDTEIARQMFKKAVEIDPQYAEAFGQLSMTYTYDVVSDWATSREQSLLWAKEAAQRAIELDPTEPMGYLALGSYYQMQAQNDLAIPFMEKAHAFNPNDFYILDALGYTLFYAGSPERGVDLLEQAQRLNPYHPEESIRNLAQAYFFARRYKDVIATLNKITRRHRTSYWLYLAASHAQLDQIDEARTAISEALRLNPDLTVEHEISRRLDNGLAPENAEHLEEALRKAGLPEKAPADRT